MIPFVKVQEQAKLIYGDRNKKSGYPGYKIDQKAAYGNFLGHANLLFE